jgi:hypothetical protein
MNDKNNPYSPHWYNKILNKRYNLSLKVNKYINGCPIVKLAKNNLPVMSIFMISRYLKD